MQWVACLGRSMVALVLVGCAHQPAPPERSLDETSAPQPSNSAAAPAAGLLPVPTRVSDLHRSFFEPSSKPIPGGKIRCLISLHSDRSSESFYVVALFGGGGVATWTQSSTGRDDPFFAKLSPEEDARASALLEAVAGDREAAADAFAASTTVMGVTTNTGETLATAYFAAADAPAALDELALLLKQRLEATNAR